MEQIEQRHEKGFMMQELSQSMDGTVQNDKIKELRAKIET
jgi:hypothetical protein